MNSISIITASYNASDTIRSCFACVQNQSIEVEHILIDGESTDTTLEIATEHGSHLTRIISEPDKGIYDAMNKGLKIAEGEVVGILNADDFYADANVLAKVIKIFTDPVIDACYGDLLYVDGVDSDKVVRYWKSGPFNYKRFYQGWMPPHPTFFVRRSVYEKYGFFNVDLGSAADYEIMLRFLVKHRVKVAYIPEILVKMKTGGVSNASLKNRLAANSMDRKAWEINNLKPYPWTLIMKPLRKAGQWFSRPEVQVH